MTGTDEPEDMGVSRIRDDRVRFYLDNFKMIETWAQVRKDANEELHEIFLDMTEELTVEATDRGFTDAIVRVDDHTDPKKPRILITKRAWCSVDDETPAAAMAIEWYQPPIDKNGELNLYVGVRVGDRRRRGLRVAKHLSGLAPALRRTLGNAWNKEHESFPIWRWIQPEGDAIDEVSLVNEARQAAWACWEATAHHIDEALGEA